MTRTSAMESLMENYQDFQSGDSQRKFDKDRTVDLITCPVERFSYALMRGSLNVLVQQHFADNLNSLAFGQDNFCTDVINYVPQAWPQYLEEVQETLPSARLTQLCELEFKEWGQEECNGMGAWHRLAFPEFEINLLLQVTNPKSKIGAFAGVCFLENDNIASYELPGDHQITTCHHLGPLHLTLITDEILEALGIPLESVFPAIK